MEATRGEAVFHPVILTLKTEEEAVLMWDLLNCSEEKSFEDYKKERVAMKECHTWDLHCDMWWILDSIFHDGVG